MKDIKLVPGKIRELSSQERKQHPKFYYIVCEEYRCYFDDKQVIVPVGFLSDGASKAPDVGRSWLIHDYLYATHQFADGTLCTRKQADDIMYAILQYERNFLYSYAYYTATKVVPCMFMRSWKKSGTRGAIILTK